MTTALTGWKKLRENTPNEGDVEGALHAKKQAQGQLAFEQSKAQRTAEIAARLKELREHNHFADLIAETMYRKT
jgi:hypothetical protein